MTTSAPAISVRGLRKQYGTLPAVDGIDLDIECGEVFGLLGPNGAGKTTFVEMLEGYRARTGGEASVLGADPAVAGAAWRARIGIVLQTTGAFDELSPEEVLRHFATFYPRPMSVDRAISLAGLDEKRRDRCKNLSGGQRRRVDLALGLIGDPELVFLDEPTTGFDPGARHQAWDVVRGLTSLGKTVILTTHYLDEAEALADRVGVIASGKLLAVAPPRELGGRDHARTIVSFKITAELAGLALPPLDASATIEHGVARIETGAPTAAVSTLAAWARGHGVDELPGLTVARPTLEDTYLTMIAAQPDAAAAAVASQ